MVSKADVLAGSAFVRLWLRDDLSKVLTKTLKGVGSSLSSFGANAKQLGGAMLAGGAAIAAPLAGALAVGANFEDVMLDIAASTGVTTEELARLNAAALSAKVGPRAAAESFLELLKAGMSLEEVLGGAGEAAIAFGRVGKMEAGEAAVVMADSMKVFGVAADVAANTISAAADASSTDIQGMAQAFAQSSAVAALADQSIEDLAASLAVLANAGVKGSDAGTSMKTMLLRLMAPTDDSAKAMQELGLQTEKLRDNAGNMLPLVQIIAKVNAAMTGMNEAAKDNALRRIFGTDAIRAAAILTSSGVAGFNEMRDAMTSALPVGEKFSTMMGGLSGLKVNLLASLERIGITIATSLAPVLAGIAPHIERAAVWFGEFAKANTWLGPALAATAVALTTAGAAIVAIGFGATSIASVITSLGVLVGLKATLLPVAAALVGIAAGLAALKGLDAAGIIDFGPVLTAAKETGDYLLGVFMPMLGTIKDAFTTAWGGISAAIREGDWQAAGDIAMAGLEVAVAAGLLTMRTMWEDYRQAVLETLTGTVLIAIDMMEKLSAIGGPFAKLLAGGAAGKARDIIGGALGGADARGIERIADAQKAVADAQLRLREKSQRANEFVEEIKQPEIFVEDIKQPEIFVEDFDPYLPDMAEVPDFGNEPGAVDISEEDRKGIWESPMTSRGVGSNLTTYNAAAAQAAGFMGGGSPVEKMATNIYEMSQALKELGLLSREQTVTNQQVATMYERFLAAMSYQ